MFLSSLNSKDSYVLRDSFISKDILDFKNLFYFKRFFSAFSIRSKWNSERVCSISA